MLVMWCIYEAMGGRGERKIRLNERFCRLIDLGRTTRDMCVSVFYVCIDRFGCANLCLSL